jgi:hypothetical protein
VLVTVPGEGDSQVLRYLLHVETVADLIGCGVRMVTVSGSMFLTSAGTRYFQRRTGFVPVWLRPVPGPTESVRPMVESSRDRLRQVEPVPS